MDEFSIDVALLVEAVMLEKWIELFSEPVMFDVEDIMVLLRLWVMVNVDELA